MGFVIHVITQHSCPFLTDFFKFKHVTPMFLSKRMYNVVHLHSSPPGSVLSVRVVVSSLHDLVGFRSDN